MGVGDLSKFIFYLILLNSLKFFTFYLFLLHSGSLLQVDKELINCVLSCLMFSFNLSLCLVAFRVFPHRLYNFPFQTSSFVIICCHFLNRYSLLFSLILFELFLCLHLHPKILPKSEKPTLLLATSKFIHLLLFKIKVLAIGWKTVEHLTLEVSMPTCYDWSQQYWEFT